MDGQSHKSCLWMVLSGLKIHLNLIKSSWKSYNEDSNENFFLEVDVQYLEKVHDLHNDLPFSSERIKIEKVGKIIANFHDKKNSSYTWNI